MFNLVYLANFKDFLELCQEKSFLDAVSKWPISQETFKKGDSQCSILCKEEHGTSEELLIELGASLNLM